MAQFGDFTVDRNSTKYVLGSGGTIISYATDEPAFEFNADGSYKGLLVEPAATNLATYSEEVGNAGFWNANVGISVTLNSTTSPDGSVNGSLLEDTATFSYLRANFTLSSAGNHCLSFYAKANGSSWIGARFLAFTGSTAGGVYTSFDLANGLVGTDGNVFSTIEDVGNGWYRCSIVDTIDSGDLIGGIQITLSSADNNRTVVGDGTSSIYIYGAQLETGPIATSYIPTTTASVTRVKDDITQTGAQSLIGQTEGTLYLEVDWRSTSGANQILLSVNDGTSSNRMLIYNSSGGTLTMRAQANGITVTEQGESSSAYSGIQKIAFAYKTDDFELYRNGSSISSDTSGSLALLATMTDVDLGQSFTASIPANMHIRAVAIYPTRLSDAECEALTTL